MSIGYEQRSPTSVQTSRRPRLGRDQRFLAGESAADEADIVRQWLDAHLVDHELVERLDGIATLELPADLDVDAALAKVHARIDQATEGTVAQGVHRGLHSSAPSRMPLYIGGALAAAAAIFALVTLGAARRQAGRRGHSRTGARLSHEHRPADSITLGDGSRVILGPDSRLTVPAAYGTAARAVELQGDGYFDVRHDAASPFSVRVGNAVVDDIGTTFTVESDGGDATVVAVVSGSVRLRPAGSAAGAGAVLAAGDRGSMTTDGTVSTYPHAVGSDDTAWTTGRLVFNDASLARVAAELHRWYGVNMRFADSSLLNTRYTNSFQGEPVDQVLKVIGMTLELRIDRQGDSATVYRRGPAPSR